MESRNFRDRDVDIDLERGMDEVVSEDDFTGRRSEGEEKMGLLDNKRARKKACRKPPKPPRPPRPPLLDAADQKLVQEISEIAMLKRARVERMKALKNMKNKGASSGSSLCALVITVLFCFIIIWQGVFSRGSSGLSFQGSPSSTVNRRGVNAIQLNQNFPRGSRRSHLASP